MIDSQSNPDPRGSGDVFRFGPFVLDVAARSLRRDGEEIHLQPRVFDLLLALVSRPGEAFGKETLVAEVWRGQVVGDAALARAVSELRRALGDPASEPVYVETLPRVGVRFAAAVERSARVTAQATEAVAPGIALPDAPDAAHGMPDPSRRRLAIAIAAALGAAGIGALAWRRARPARVIGLWPVQAADSDAAGSAPVVSELLWRTLDAGDALVVRRVTAPGATPEDLARAGRELGISHALVPRLAHDGTRMTLSAQLLDTSGGVHASYSTAALDAPPALAAALATSLAASFEATPPRAPALDDGLRNAIAAADEYSLGRSHLRTRRAELAQPAFERALALDPAHTPSQAGLSLALALRARGHRETAAELARAEALAAEALRRDDTLALAHLASGFVAMRRDAEPAEAIEAKLTAALARDPALTDGYVWRATVRTDRGFVREAVEDLEHAVALDPANPSAVGNLVGQYASTGRRRDADMLLHRAQATLADPRQLDYARYGIATSEGRLADAVDLVLPYLEVSPTVPLTWSLLASALARLDDGEAARSAIARLSPTGAGTGAAEALMLLGDAAGLDALLARPVDAGRPLAEHERRARTELQGVAHAMARRWSQAVATLSPLFADPKDVAGRGGTFSWIGSLAQWLAYALGETGESGRARSLLDAVAAHLAVRAAHGVTAYAPDLLLGARNTAMRGTPDEAFAQLETAMAAGYPLAVTIRHDPRWDALRADARFAPLAARVAAWLADERAKLGTRVREAIAASAAVGT